MWSLGKLGLGLIQINHDESQLIKSQSWWIPMTCHFWIWLFVSVCNSYNCVRVTTSGLNVELLALQYNHGQSVQNLHINLNNFTNYSIDTSILTALVKTHRWATDWCQPLCTQAEGYQRAPNLREVKCGFMVMHGMDKMKTNVKSLLSMDFWSVTLKALVDARKWGGTHDSEKWDGKSFRGGRRRLIWEGRWWHFMQSKLRCITRQLNIKKSSGFNDVRLYEVTIEPAYQCIKHVTGYGCDFNKGKVRVGNEKKAPQKKCTLFISALTNLLRSKDCSKIFYIYNILWLTLQHEPKTIHKNV